MTRPELLAPAGNLNKLKLAFYYGADAVYVGGKSFSLRTFADNFTDEELAEGIAYAHARGKKVYVAVNIFARNADFERLTEYFRTLERLGADAVLISDLGVFRACRKAAPDLPIHISTQANTTNSQSAAMWKELGASRVVLARELRLLNGNEFLRMANGAFHHIIRDDLAANSTSLHKSYLLIFSDCPLQDLCDCIIA